MENKRTRTRYDLDFKVSAIKLIVEKHQNKYQTRLEVKQDLFEYTEVFYNRKRLHSALGYKTPVKYGKMKHVA